MKRWPIFGFLIAVLAPASRAATFTVTNTADSGAGSLRQAVADAGALAGADTIVFAPALGGRTILLSTGRLRTTDADGVTIDATALPAGLVLQGANADRVFNNSGILTLRGLILTGGNVGACCGGGAVYSSGTMTIDRCALTGNSSPNDGGAIYNDGTMTIDRSLLYGNQAGYGAAVYHNGAFSGSLTIRQSTITGNTASQYAALYSLHPLTLIHVTIANNGVLAPATDGALFSGDTLSLENSVIGGNAGTTDLSNTGVVTRIGANVLEKAPTGAGTISGSGTIAIAAPQLAPLTDNGGPTRTMLPQSGSPLIDAAAGSTETVDQRGFPRPLDGNLDNTAVNDIGAAEYDPFIVTTTADSGPGSLRQLLTTAAAHAGVDTITFAPTLSGKTLLLASQLSTSDSAKVSVNATALPAGFTLSGGNVTRIFFNTGTLDLQGLTLTAGYAGSAAPVSPVGGAVYNAYPGLLTVDRCTMTNNYAYTAGGAIYNERVLGLTNSTLSGNQAGTSGGGLGTTGLATSLFHTTITGNSANYGGGVENEYSVTLQNSVVAYNSASTAPASADFYNYFGTLTRTGVSFVPLLQNNGGTITGAGTLLTADPALLPLAWNGGPTMTRLPQPGSPAIDAASATALNYDQRGAARPVGPLSDSGATETGGCARPEYPVDGMRLAKGAVAGTVNFSFPDANAATARTGYTVRRAGAASAPGILYEPVGFNVPDQDGGTAGYQWTDPTATVSPTGIWFYQVTAANAACGIEGPY